MYYTVIKHDGHLRTQGKCRKHEPQASVFYIYRVFSNYRSVTALRVIEIEIQYTCGMQYKVMSMNSGCVACRCQLIPLSGSAQRETISGIHSLIFNESVQRSVYKRVTNCQGPHTINTANVCGPLQLVTLL